MIGNSRMNGFAPVLAAVGASGGGGRICTPERKPHQEPSTRKLLKLYSRPTFGGPTRINVSIINDLPLFIDPFLLFNSPKPDYQQLHPDILKYMMFLRDKIISGSVNDDLVKAWFMFPEVKQNWL